MNAQPAVKRRIGIGLVAVCATLLTSACATGQKAQTASEVPAIDGTSGTIGSIQLHEVAIAAPPNGPSYAQGDSAVLEFTLVNTGHVADTLTAISTPVASGYRVFATAADASAAASSATAGSGAGSSAAASSAPPSSAADSSTPSGGTTTAAQPSSSGRSGSGHSSAAGSSTAASGSAAPSSSAATSSAPPAPATFVLPPGQLVSLGVTPTDRVLTLSLTEPLFPGPSVPITFTFASAGSVTLPVPVQITTSGTAPLGITVPPLSSGGAG